MSSVAQAVRVALSVALGLMFLAAGIAKLLDPAAVAVTVVDLFAMPATEWGRAVAAVQAVGAFEIVCAVLVLLRRALGVHAIVVFVALLAFVAWDVSRAVIGDAPDCRCFGSLVLATAWWHVWAKHVIVFVTFTAYVCLPKRDGDVRPVENSAPRSVGGGDPIVSM